MSRRLYVAGSGKGLVFCLADNKEAAQITLGPGYRAPDPDDLRIVWRMAKLDEMSGLQVQQMLGISRQTLSNWWHKAGGEGVLRRRSEHQVDARLQMIRDAIRENSTISAAMLARKLGVAVVTIRQVAQELGVQLRRVRKRPTDEELIEMARGRTWRELADASEMTLSALRAYIYANPELSKAIAKVRAPVTTGRTAHGKIDYKKVKELYFKGYSAYRISQELRVEPMSVRHWLKKLAHEEALREKARNERPAPDLMGSSFGGKYG